MGNYPKRRSFIPEDRPPAFRRLRASTHLYRAASVHVRKAATKDRSEPEAIARTLFGNTDEPTRILLQRAASTQATTTTTGWAAEIAQHSVRDMIADITSISAAAEIIGRGLQVDLGTFAQLTIPGRTLTAANAGTWVAEGAAIPVRALAMTNGAVLVPRKLAVIACYTREMAESSLIEDITRQTMGEAAAVSLDAALFGTQPDDNATPRGLLNGVTALTPTAGGGLAAMVSDIKALFAALSSNMAGKNAILVVSTDLLASLKLMAGPKFDVEVFGSTGLPAKTIVALEPSSFVSGFDATPEFAVSNAGLLHIEDTTPSGPTSVPAKSMFQIDALALRMTLRSAWGMRATGHVQYITGATW
jgi:hypothetical protein